MSTAPTRTTHPMPQILTTHNGRRLAGPGLLKPLLSGRAFRQGPEQAMLDNAREYGDLVHYRAAGRNIFQFNHPDLIHEMLVVDAKHHHRGMVMQRSKIVLGEGLLTSEDPLHMRQRRLAQPAFHRDRIAAYGEIIGQFAMDAMAAWTPGAIRNLHTDMQTLALRIVGKTLFDQEMVGDTKRIAEAIEAFMGFLPLVFLPFSTTIQKLPIPMMQRIRRGRADLDTLIYRIIAERRAAGPDGSGILDRGDLLSMLLAAEDTEENTGGMSDSQVRDECVTTLLAGNETTANALSFALALLAQHPEAQAKLHAEAAEVLGVSAGEGAGPRPATAADYGHLRYAWTCFAESMRLYPPVWVTARTAAVAYSFRGFPIPEGSILLAPQIVAHRDPRFWEQPERFDPARFVEEARAARPRMSYFPFAAGSRQCIGEGLAWMEGVLSLASFARSWRFSPPADGPAAAIEVKARVSLRPRGEVPLLVEPWTATTAMEPPKQETQAKKR